MFQTSADKLLHENEKHISNQPHDGLDQAEAPSKSGGDEHWRPWEALDGEGPGTADWNNERQEEEVSDVSEWSTYELQAADILAALKK